MSNKSKIHIFSAKKLFYYGKKVSPNQNRTLLLNYEHTKFAHKYIKDEDFTIDRRDDYCQLFDQISKEFQNENVEIGDVLILIDFNDASKKIYEKLKSYPSITLSFEEGKEVTFVDFLKSSSMAARKKQVYYINKEYAERVKRRTTFNFDEIGSKINIPKWYSASGLLLSGCNIFSELKIEPDEIVIVKDYEQYVKQSSVITVISKESIKKTLEDLRDIYEFINKDNNKDKTAKINEKDKIISNLNAIRKSNDFTNICKEDDVIKRTFVYLEGIGGFNEETSDLLGINEALELLSKDKSYDEDNKRRESKIEWHKVLVNDYYIKSNFFDGEGLVSESFAKEINDAIRKRAKEKICIFKDEVTNDENIATKDQKDSGSFQIRLPFIKGVLHTANFAEFFKDHDVKYIEGLSYASDEVEKYKTNNPDKLERTIRYENLDKIKIILTESQVKYIDSTLLSKYFANEKDYPIISYFKKLNELDYHLGINNIDPKIKKNNVFRMNHEFWSTLPLDVNNQDERNDIINKAKEATLRKINGTINVRNILEFMKNDVEKVDKLKTLITDPGVMIKDSIFEKDYQVARVDQEYYFKSKRGNKMRKKSFDSQIEDAMIGKVYINGERRFLCSDLLLLLYSIANKKYDDIPANEYLMIHKFYAPRLTTSSYNKSRCVILRTPHYSRNEIVVLSHQQNDEVRHKYFSKLHGTIMVNPLSLSAERLGGADQDGDTVYIITESSLNNYVIPRILPPNESGDGHHYLYPIISIPSLKTEKKAKTLDRKIDSWKYGFDSKIGLISNRAFTQSVSVYSFLNNKNESIYSNKEEQDAIAQYTILSGLDIDAKKTGLVPASTYYQTSSSKYARKFNEKKKHPKRIDVDKYEDESSILIEFNKEFKNMVCPTPDFKDKYRSKYFIENVKVSDNSENNLKALMRYSLYHLYLRYVEERKKANDIKEMISEILIKKCTNEVEYSPLSAEIIKEEIQFKDSNKALNIYQTMDTPYHYLLTVKERKEALKQFDFKKDKIENKIENFITSFSNEGYKNLYHLIRYQILEDKFNINESKGFEFLLTPQYRKNISEKTKRIDIGVDDIETLMKVIVNEFYSMYISLNKFENKRSKDIEDYLYNKYPNINISNVASIIKDIKDDEINMYSIFIHELVKYLENGEQDV